MKKVITVGALLIALAAAALAQGNSWFWIIPETWVCVFNYCPGTTQPLILDVAVPPEFVGQTCEVQATTANNASVHVNNDVEIVSGGQSVWMFNVEGLPNSTTYTADGSLTLGPDVDMYIHMGPDGRWSAELDMAFICLDGGPTPTPTNTPTATATQPGPTATATSTSTATATATTLPTVTNTPPGPTPTPTNTPGPTSVEFSGMSGEADNQARNVGIGVGLLIVASLFIWTVRKRQGE